MSTYFRNRSNVFQILLIAWLFCSSSIVNGQSPIPQKVVSPYPQTPYYQPPEARVPEKVPSPYAPSLHKFTFKHAKAADVLRILIQLSGDDNANGLAVDERTNSIVFLADAQEASESEASFNLLDTETPVTLGTGRGLSVSVPALGPEPLAFDFSIGIEHGGSVQSLEKQYKALEQQAHQLADKLKQSTSLSESQRTELQLAVRKSFEARQSLQRAELADLARRMKSMQQSIDMRDKLADKVVQRRVEDLLNPNLKWDAGKVSEQLLAGPNQGSSNPAMPLPPSPVPSSVSVPYVPGEPPATVIRKRIQGRWIVQTHSDGNKDALADSAGQVEVEIEGNSMRYLVGKQDTTGPIFLTDCKELESLRLREDGPLPIDFVYDPNGDPQTFHGIIACDGTTLSICMASDEGRANKDFRPSLFVPGTKVTLIKCRRAEPETANADVSNETDSISPSLSSTQAAVTRLLAQLPHFATPQGDVDTAPIAFLGIDYQGPWSLGDFRDELQKEIEAQISQSSSCSLVSRRMSDYAMMATRVKPTDVVKPMVQKILTQSLRSQDIKVQGLMFARLKHLGDSDSTRNGEFVVSLELFDINQHSYNERATTRNDRSSSDSRKKEPQLLQGRWIIESWSKESEDQLSKAENQFELRIDGHAIHVFDDVGNQHASMLLDEQNIEPAAYNGIACPVNYIIDPNGDRIVCPGILELDGEILRICYSRNSIEGADSEKFRPSLFIPGSKVTLIKCRRAEPETANAVSVDHPIWKSQVQQATSKLLAAFPVPPAMDQNDFPKVIAIVDVDYQGKQEVGNLKEEIYEWIAADIPFAPLQGSYALLSRSAVKLAMQETRLRPRDLARSSPSYIENRQRILNQLRSHELKVDALLITSLKHREDLEDAIQNQFEVTLEGFIDARTTNWLERVNVNGKAKGQSREPLGNSLPQFDTPQALLARVDENGKSGSYENFVTLFSDEGVRDLAGSLLMQAVMQTSIDELARQLAFGLAEVDPDFVAFRKVLQRWLPQSVTTAQQEAMGKGLSTMMSSTGGASPDQTAMKEFVTSMRDSVEGISDHRKFCIEIMQAFEKLTTRKFVFFGNADHKNEWQISPFGDRAIATLIDGSPGMATTITLQQATGTWSISSLFNERVIEAQPATTLPSSTASIPSNAKTVTRCYSVGSFVTEGFFTGKGSYDTKEVYDKYETKIEQSLQDLAKTVTATCSQPPKFVQVLSSSRCLLIGHTEVGHQEIADLMSDIGISNDRIRLRGVAIEITSDEAKTLGIKLTQRVLSSEESEKLREFQKAKKPESENSSQEFNFVAMDETIQSGTQTHVKTSVKTSGVGMQFPFAARIIPGTKEVQVRMDFHGASGGVEFFAPRIKTLRDGESVLFVFGDDFCWLATADIVRDASAEPSEAERPISKYLPPTNAMEMQQRLQGEWDVKVMGISADVSDKRPYQAVVRGQLFLLQVMEDGKVIGTSPWKIIWPEADHPDVVDIVWDPNNNSDADCAPGRITCDGKSFQLAFRSGKVSGKFERPIEICSGDGVSYFECVRKQPTEISPASVDSKANARTSSTAGPKYSGHALSWWLDSYWDNATANPKTAENEAQEYAASEAIRKLRELPESKPDIEEVLAKWFAAVEHEVNEVQLIRAAKCIVFAAGPRNQKAAVDYLFEIAKQVPVNPGEDLGQWIDCWDDELGKALKELVLNDELATQIADRLKTGNSAQRRFAVTLLLNRGASNQPATQDQTEANAWFRSHDKLFYPAFEAASQDTSEAIRMFALITLTGLDPHNSQLLLRLTSAVESDPSTQVRCVAIHLLCSKELASAIETQSVELQPLLMKTLEADSSLDVKYNALEVLLKSDPGNDLVHSTILQWAKSDEGQKVEYALKLMLLNQQTGDRPQSIDELVELLSDSEWGVAKTVTDRISSEHIFGVMGSRKILARQHAIQTLGHYAAHAHRALPTLEAEFARNTKETLSFATKALDSVRGYCPDRPVDQLQGQWEFVSVNRPNSTTAFFDFPLHDGGVYPAVGRELRTASDQLPASIITVSGTQLKLGDRVLAEISHQRQNLEVVMLLDPDGKKRHCNGRYELKGGPSPEYKPNAAPAPELLILEVCELRNDSDTTQATKQTFEFRPVKK